MLAWLGWLGVATAASAPVAGRPPLLALSSQAPAELVGTAWLAEAGVDEPFPAPGADLATWFAGHRPAAQISLQGGHYWLAARLRHDDTGIGWVFDPHNTLIERVELQLSGSDGSLQRRVAGYAEPRAHMLHYGQGIELKPGVEYQALVRLDSRYFASVPRLQFGPEPAFQRKVLSENLLVLGSLGAMVALALFNLFLYTLTRTASHLYYFVQLSLSVWAWSMVFQIPTELWGWQGLTLHYLPFFLMPPAASLFCIDFLSLRQRHRRLYALHCGVIVAGVLLAPVAVLALPWANLVASLLISAWMALTLTSGFVSLRAGYRPARFFVLAFMALAIPGLIILPGNLDLIPDLVDNAEAWTLLGSAFEALLQAFALADRIRLLGQEKDHVAEQLIHTLQVAHTDAMTGLGNRYAFDLMVERRSAGSLWPDQQPCLLAVIDLDGLKLINDQQGHARGDDLIRAVGLGLQAMQVDGTRCYRLGGDEFGILAPRHLEGQIAEQLMQLELELLAGGFEQSGVSFGIAHWEPGCDPFELLKRADGHMYQNKARRKAERRAAAQAARAAEVSPTSLLRPE
ncbi:diguanylate cyclase [Ideonella sp.]|uniref:diguanylate cyclase n=1 Tax=Ideonella sp. TaxID=1929293 RepID=UPI002B47A717|nr:diguanylate cyclase [Ideonella sp.]HJV70702.1 diguanylate cyclase [Ideonella sp.]